MKRAYKFYSHNNNSGSKNEEMFRLKVTEKKQAGQLLAALQLPPPNQKDWCGIFSVGYLPCYMLSIQLGVMVSTVQNPLAKSAIVKV